MIAGSDSQHGRKNGIMQTLRQRLPRRSARSPICQARQSALGSRDRDRPDALRSLRILTPGHIALRARRNDVKRTKLEWLVLAAGSAALLWAPAAKASIITEAFAISLGAGSVDVGTFSYNSSSVVPGGNVTGPGLLTNLNFAFNGVNYNTANVSTGLLSFDSAGNLTNFRFGTNCSGNSATACGLAPMDPNSWLVQGPGTSGFAYNNSTGNAAFGTLAAAPVPVVPNATTYAFGISLGAGAADVGTFSYRNSSVVPSGNVTGPGLLTNVNFVFNGNTYNTANVSTGLLSFDALGKLTNFRFGTNCSGNSATACGLAPMDPNSWLVQGPGTSGFAYNNSTGNAAFGTLAALQVPASAVPEPGSLELLGGGLMFLGLIGGRRRRFGNRKRSALPR